MPTETVRRHVMERSPNLVGKKEKKSPLLSKHLQKVHPLGINRSSPSLSVSPLSLSQNSNDSSFCGSISSLDRKISMSFHGLFGSFGRREALVADRVGNKGGSITPGCREFGFLHGSDVSVDDDDVVVEIEKGRLGNGEIGSLINRCNWITKSSEEHYVSFHDDSWGVPVYDDNHLFELLSLSGMLIDHNWADIIKRRELYREAFDKFDPNTVAKMEEKDIAEIGSNKELMLAESRARCIVDNAKSILKVVKEFGSFSVYIWGHVNHRPIINKIKYPRSVPLRTPKSEFISKDLVRRGFRLVGPVIVYSFMQAAGVVVDHLVSCFRFKECAKLAERFSWSMTNMMVAPPCEKKSFPEAHLAIPSYCF